MSSEATAPSTSAPTRTVPRLAQEALGGLSAGIVGTVLGYPLDTIKARQQILGTSGIVSTARRIVSNEGPTSLYRGLVPPLISLSILNTINFTLYSYFQQIFSKRDQVTLQHSSAVASDILQGFRLENAMAGAAVGAFAGIVSTVENLVKTQLQMDNVRSKPRYRGSRDCVQQILRQGYRRGIQTLYTGHVVNTVREMVFLATYFGVYEGLRESMFHDHRHERTTITAATSNKSNQNHPWMIPLAGGLAGAVAWTVSFPLDCVRAGVQGQDLVSPHKRVSAPTVFRTLVVERGIKGLYSGVTPSIVRAFLVSGSRFTAYKAALWFLRGGRDNLS